MAAGSAERPDVRMHPQLLRQRQEREGATRGPHPVPGTTHLAQEASQRDTEFWTPSLERPR